MFCADIRLISGKDIRSASRIGNTEIAVVFGGPPCQGISLMGKRDVNDSRNELLLEFARIVAELNPQYFVMENVAGLVVGEHRLLLDEVISKLKKAGYSVSPPEILQASRYGVPQSRRRLFLIGAREGSRIADYPKPTVTPRKIDGGQEAGELPLGPSVGDALFDLPDVDEIEELVRADKAVAQFGKPSDYARRLRDVGADDHNYASPREYDKTLLTSSARTRHTKRTVERFSQTAPGTTEEVSRFLRLHPRGISNTLRAGTASDRGAYTAPRPIHPLHPRVITVREAARLHGYPDWFRFHVTKWNGFREVGNSVPVPLAQAVASSIMCAGRYTPSKGASIKPGSDSLLSFSQQEAERYFGITKRVIAARSR